MGFFEIAGAFLDGLLSDEDSMTDWIDNFADSRSAAGVHLDCIHAAFGSRCYITATIIDQNGNAIAQNSWEFPWCDEVKGLMGGQKEKFYSFD